MSPKNTSPLIAILLILGGAIFGVLGGLHAIYTLLDLRHPRRLVPGDPAVAQAMAHSILRISGGSTDVWRAWVGFNFSHSVGLLLLAAVAIGAGTRIEMFPNYMLPGLILVGGVYLVLARLYWFRAPVIGVATGTACFFVAWVLSLT